MVKDSVSLSMSLASRRALVASSSRVDNRNAAAVGASLTALTTTLTAAEAVAPALSLTTTVKLSLPNQSARGRKATWPVVSTVALPFFAWLPIENVSGSPSTSAAMTRPLATSSSFPVSATTVVVGASLTGLIFTVTAAVAVAPWPSSTTTVNELSPTTSLAGVKTTLPLPSTLAVPFLGGSPMVKDSVSLSMSLAASL